MRTLIVCEKPDAATRVARALDEDGDPRRTEAQGVPFFESRRGRETIIVCSALGHLYAVDSKTQAGRRYYPVWDCDWKPKHLIEKKAARLERWTQVIGSLGRQADRFINACDYDVEGSLIGYTILRYACRGADSNAQRMRFSTMTEKELQTAYSSLAQQLDFSQIAAGQCRHELDWLYGVNLSRFLTESALKQNKGYSTLSIGRVQGPTLRFVVEREEEIQCFTPEPFWNIEATIQHDEKTYYLEYERERIPDRASAEGVVADCRDSLLNVDAIESHRVQQAPPFPFDLSTLQSEAYRHFGYTPARTLAIAERLYLYAMISYPRTSSQKLPPDIGYSEILKGIAKSPQHSVLAARLAGQLNLRPNQGPKTDPAHPAVYPTGESPRRALNRPEGNLLDLIVRRFMATFASACIHENTRLILRKDPHRFFLRGSVILEEGWVEYYRPYTREESQNLPGLKVGDHVSVKKIRTLERFTEPPSRYNPGSLLRKMEKENIGTKASRAEIIEILYRRGYIKAVQIQATPLAVKIIRILNKYCPLITDSSFTAQLEQLMDKIQANEAVRSHVIAETLEHLRPIMLDLKAKEGEIGSQLSEIAASQRISNLTFAQSCPECSSPLIIIRSRTSGKRFVGCTGFEKGCRFTLPLPQFGSLTITQSNCKRCGFQLVRAWSKGRRPLISCARCYARNAYREKTHFKILQGKPAAQLAQ